MNLFARLVARRDARLQREIDAAFDRAPLAPEPEHDQLLAETQRIWAAEDATRAMSTRLDAALERLDAALGRLRLANTARDQALAENIQLRDHVRELGTEVVALRHLRERAQVPRGTDRRCPHCQEPMQFGMTHYCRKTSEFREEVAA